MNPRTSGEHWLALDINDHLLIHYTSLGPVCEPKNIWGALTGSGYRWPCWSSIIILLHIHSYSMRPGLVTHQHSLSRALGLWLVVGFDPRAKSSVKFQLHVSHLSGCLCSLFLLVVFLFKMLLTLTLVENKKPLKSKSIIIYNPILMSCVSVLRNGS